MDKPIDFKAVTELFCSSCKCMIQPGDEARKRPFEGAVQHFHLDVVKCLALAKKTKQAESTEQSAKPKKPKPAVRKYGKFSGRWY